MFVPDYLVPPTINGSSTWRRSVRGPIAICMGPVNAGTGSSVTPCDHMFEMGEAADGPEDGASV